MKLLEVFVDFPLRLKTYSHDPRHKVYREFEPRRKSLRVSKKRLQKLIDQIAKSHPDLNLRIVETVSKGIKYLVMRRGKVEKKNIPIYYEPKEARWFVPSSYYKAKKKLVMYVMWLRLDNLGFLKRKE